MLIGILAGLWILSAVIVAAVWSRFQSRLRSMTDEAAANAWPGQTDAA